MAFRLIKIICCLLSLVAFCFFCEWKTEGFRFYRLLSNIPDDPGWETEALEEGNRHLFDQTFTFLGKGGFCCAFLGEDQKTVLKFYLHTHLKPVSILKDFTWQKLWLLSAPSAPIPYLAFALKSSKLLYDRAKDRTGLIYVHLNKSNRTLPSATLIDPIGIRHTIDLNQTEFILQHKAESVMSYLARVAGNKDKSGAKRAIDNYLQCLLTLCKRGLKDLDAGFRNNYGILPTGEVISMDISSFIEDPQLMRPGIYKKEIVLKSHNLAKWLKKRHPELYTYYNEKMASLIEKD